MKFQFELFNDIVIYFYKSLLFLAIEKENIDAVELLLTDDKLDLNFLNKILN